MVLASAVAGTVTAAATAISAAGSLNGNFFLIRVSSMYHNDKNKYRIVASRSTS
jgi:hypothetical protein